MDAAILADVIRTAIGGAVAAVGLVFVAGGTLGLLRFPDFYTRVHAVSVSDAAGAAIVALGLAIVTPDWSIALRLLLLAALLVALGPVFAHLAASAGHAGGLTPIAGRYVAPRPGARRTPPP